MRNESQEVQALKAQLRECRFALDELISQRPGIAALRCGSTTLGNLRAELAMYRGDFATPAPQHGAADR